MFIANDYETGFWYNKIRFTFPISSVFSRRTSHNFSFYSVF